MAIPWAYAMLDFQFTQYGSPVYTEYNSYKVMMSWYKYYSHYIDFCGLRAFWNLFKMYLETDVW